jgi:hypothetical protein
MNFALLGIFYCQLCLYASLFLCLSIFLYLCLSLLFLYLSICSKPNLTLKMPAFLPAAHLLTCPPLLYLYPPSLFSNKKFPVVEAHFWLDKLFYIIDWFIYFQAKSGTCFEQNFLFNRRWRKSWNHWKNRSWKIITGSFLVQNH